MLGLERKILSGQLQLYVRRWRPSQCSVDPIEEVILNGDAHIRFIKLKEKVLLVKEKLCQIITVNKNVNLALLTKSMHQFFIFTQLSKLSGVPSNDIFVAEVR